MIMDFLRNFILMKTDTGNCMVTFIIFNIRMDMFSKTQVRFSEFSLISLEFIFDFEEKGTLQKSTIPESGIRPNVLLFNDSE